MAKETHDKAPRTVTMLLRAWTGGDQEALDALIPIVYDELRSLAGRLMRGEQPGRTMQTTALVHEAYLRLVDSNVSWEGRAHFFRVAARQMRHILVDNARARFSAKRGGQATRLSLDESLLVQSEPPPEILDLDRALGGLSKLDARKGQIVELRVFGGLTHEEIARVLGIGQATVRREMRIAKAWLRSELEGGDARGD